MSESSSPPPPEPRSTLESVKDVAAGVLGSVQTRLELLSNELAEERARFELAAIFAIGLIFFGSISFILLTLLAVVMIDDQTTKEIVFAVIVFLYIMATATCGLLLRKQLKDRGKPFHSTIEELRKDRDRISHLFNRQSE